MSSALCALFDLITVNPAPHKNLVPSFVSILKQIVEHRLPKQYDYHRVPAPFMQVKLLKILAKLGTCCAFPKSRHTVYRPVRDVHTSFIQRQYGNK